jgi:excisionase family DNA binding protein
VNKEELEELRERVARKRRIEEAAKLTAELSGLDKPIDESVVYLSVREAADRLGAHVDTIKRMCKDGCFPKAVLAKGGGGKYGGAGRRWAIHPEDVKSVENRFRRLVK